jgi:hypothetical protein
LQDLIQREATKISNKRIQQEITALRKAALGKKQSEGPHLQGRLTTKKENTKWKGRKKKHSRIRGQRFSHRNQQSLRRRERLDRGFQQLQQSQWPKTVTAMKKPTKGQSTQPRHKSSRRRRSKIRCQKRQRQRQTTCLAFLIKEQERRHWQKKQSLFSLVDRDIIAAFGFVANPSLSTRHNASLYLAQMPTWQYFERPTIILSWASTLS